MLTVASFNIEKAKACNSFYLEASGAGGFPAPFDSYKTSSKELAIAVTDWQKKRLLLIDGILGPKTSAALEGREWTPPKGERYFIVGGEKVPTPFMVVNWLQPGGLSFQKVQQAIPNFNGTPPRDDPRPDSIDKLVLHWDEAHSSHDCFHTLIWRNLAVQLCLDSDGTVYQTMDFVDLAARHARWANQTSIGIEIANPIHLDAGKEGDVRDVVEEGKPHTDNQVWRYLGFTPLQKFMISRLVPAICESVGIPKRLPRDGNAEVYKGLMPEPHQFQGVLGHYHLQLDKVDPGYSLWPLLIDF